MKRSQAAAVMLALAAYGTFDYKTMRPKRKPPTGDWEPRQRSVKPKRKSGFI